VDVVSVDYVADAIYELCESPGGVGETYHLTAGAQASTIQEIADAASRYFDKPLPTVTAPDAAAAPGESGEAGEDPGSAYFPYFSVKTVFDDAHTRARLEPAGVRVSPLNDYLERLLDFATRSRWGKRPIGRAEALAP
jgi:nucleoside-diphosphate-sugar epimerase